VVMNPVVPIGLIAAIAATEGKAFAYPGRHAGIHEAIDARLVARACQWAFDTRREALQPSECPRAIHDESCSRRGDNGVNRRVRCDLH